MADREPPEDALAARLRLWRERAGADTYVDRATDRATDRAVVAEPVRHPLGGDAGDDAGDDAGMDCPLCGEPMVVIATTREKRVVGCPDCEHKERR